MDHLCTFSASGHHVDELHLFRDADDGAIARMLAGCAVVRAKPGESIVDPGKARLYIVLRGALAVAADTSSGMNDGTVSTVLAGESVGEQSVLDDETNRAAISALQESDLLVIEAELVWQLIDTSNVLARNLLRLLSFRIRAANAQLRRRQKVGEFYRQLSMVDGLTGLYNRAWLNDVLPTLVAAAHDTASPLSLIMIDLDHFKRFNDTHGHPEGDQALRAAARVLNAASRPTDSAVRYGGEELMVILPDTNASVAEKVALRLCERMRQAVVFPDMRNQLPHITASLGVASLGSGHTERDLIAAADAALYRAKHGGRDRVST